jgi:hypothetical protein
MVLNSERMVGDVAHALARVVGVRGHGVDRGTEDSSLVEIGEDLHALHLGVAVLASEQVLNNSKDVMHLCLD